MEIMLYKYNPINGKIKTAVDHPKVFEKFDAIVVKKTSIDKYLNEGWVKNLKEAIVLYSKINEKSKPVEEVRVKIKKIPEPKPKLQRKYGLHKKTNNS